MTKRIALVTGASSGIGADTARRLAQAGFTVYAAARRLDRMEALKQHGIKVLHLDITEEQSIRACVATIEAESGGVDVLVNNAGYGSYGAVEEVPMQEARRQFEVNLFGLAMLTQLVIPHMRKKRWGRIINVSSIGGVSTTPYGAWYHSTKFALEGYSAALRQELNPFGVEVVVIRPGGTESEWGGIAMDSLEKVSGRGPYRPAVQRMMTAFRQAVSSPMMHVPATTIAEAIFKAATATRPKTVYLGPGVAKLFVFLAWLLSDRAYDAFKRRASGLPRTM